jgi:uncharacterized protein with ATP-grasp and redox domains
MRTYLDCYSCLVQQAVDAGRRACDEPVVQERILREALAALAKADLSLPPPLCARLIGEIIQRHTGVDDPYLEAKQRSNEFALSLLERCRSHLATSTDPLATAIRLAAAGNIIDFGIHGAVSVGLDWVETSIAHALEAPLDPVVLERFRERAANARRILYLADNAGELAFDRLLIEQLPKGAVTVAVKGGPILNDALLEDAQAVGIGEVAAIIDNGAQIPGTWLPDCSPEFREHFAAADVVISKGQGNFETLSDTTREVFFLLKVKCPMVSQHLATPVGTILLANLP